MQPTLDEQELVSKAQQGDEEAVALLYEAHVESIFGYLSYRVDSISVAEDLTSEVFLRMVRALANYKNQGVPFRAWLFRIASNLLTDYYRHRGKNQTAPVTERYESADPDLFDHVAKEEEESYLHQAIRTLPEDYQNLLILRFIEDLSHTEIARIMNKSADALRAMQYRALKALGEQLERSGKDGSYLWGNEQ